MAFSPEHVAALETAIATGQLRVQIGDLVIHSQTGADLLNALRMARADQASASNNDPMRYRIARSCDG